MGVKPLICCSIVIILLILQYASTTYPSRVQLIEKREDAIKYEPNWGSLDKRPLPSWFDESKVGIFLHWGVFSVPSFQSEWFWTDWKDAKAESVVNFMTKNYPPNFSYQEFAKDFTAEFFDPDEWAKLFKNAGAKYVVLTSKHHEGYTLWPSRYSFGWNSMDVGPHRDLIGDLSEAVRRQNLTFGLYHSWFEWYNPMYLADKLNLFLTQDFVVNKVLPEMHELVNNYKPDIIWSDGDWEALDIYWNSTGFLAWLYNESPVKDTVVVNDRWGVDTPCKHGGYYSCKDRYNPGVLQDHKWENAMTLDKRSWGFRRNAQISDFLTSAELVTTLVQTVSCGGNILINVGPTKEGTIVPIFQERLLDLGKWLEINGEAIYKSTPWTVQNDTLTPAVWYTQNNDNVYPIILNWPTEGVIKLKSAVPLFKKTTKSVQLLGNEGEELKWVIDSNQLLNVQLPEKARVKSQWAWVLKIATT